MSRRVLITGSRHWTDEEPIRELIDSLPADAIVIHGNAPGADSIADRWALARGLHVKAWQADWSRRGKAAGPERNQRMIDEGKPTEAHAFVRPDSKGTWDCVRRCEAAGIPVTITKATRCPSCQKVHPSPKGMKRKLCAACALRV